MSSEQDKHLNRDPITGTPGAHPVGTGLGAVAGAAAAGAAVGTVAGPIGPAIGAAVGAVAGGLAGKAVAEAIDPTAEHAHWQEHHTREPYYSSEYTYEDYGPAYSLGWRDVHTTPADARFEDVEESLAHDWAIYRGQSRLDWPEASPAARAAWERAKRRGRMMV